MTTHLHRCPACQRVLASPDASAGPYKLLDLGAVPDWLVLAAMRYCLGHCGQRARVSTTWLIQMWPFLPAHVRAAIQKDVDYIFELDEQALARGDVFRLLGSGCDREAWELVQALWKK